MDVFHPDGDAGASGKKEAGLGELRSQDCTAVSPPDIQRDAPFGPSSSALQEVYAWDIPFPLLRLWPTSPLCSAPRAARPLTCHHACNGRRSVAALPAGGDVGWVSGQRRPHHLSPCENTARSHQLGPRRPLHLLSSFLEDQPAFPLATPLSPRPPPNPSPPPLSSAAHRLCRDRPGALL